jgi:hypothetical protein
MLSDMTRVATLIEERCAGRAPFQAIGRRVVAQPGKRIRSRFLLACAGLTDRDITMQRDAVEAAAAIELLHEASLVHEDICHAAPERCGVSSVVAAFGIRTAALAGAFFAGQALALLGPVLERRGQQIELSLAVVAGVEQWAALLTRVDSASRHHEPADSVMGRLFRWHAAGELARRSVSLNLLRAFSRSELMAVRGFLVALLVVTTFSTITAAMLLVQIRHLTLRAVQRTRWLTFLRESVSWSTAHGASSPTRARVSAFHVARR